MDPQLEAPRTPKWVHACGWIVCLAIVSWWVAKHLSGRSFLHGLPGILAFGHLAVSVTVGVYASPLRAVIFFVTVPLVLAALIFFGCALAR
jgi:hypothetical protein